MTRFMALALAAALILCGCADTAASSGGSGASMVVSDPKPLPSPGSQTAPAAPSSSKPQTPPSSSLPASSSSVPAPSISSSSAASSAPTGGGVEDIPEPDDSDDWSLVLVNADNPLSVEPTPVLEEVGGYKFDKRMSQHLRDFLAAAKADGISLVVISGFRTFARSEYLYDREVQSYISQGYTKEDALVQAAMWVAPPGTSEHHTGLAADIISGDYYTKHPDLQTSFEKDKEAVWMAAHCAEYGFVLRYPKDKTDITGIGFEPWHFRYVGEENARYIMENGLCLEEYVTLAR